jgi:1-aminocyclopropane-1-carboxylate deaminase/D-cysteine desulfhydrase-like pyridoxal-dependent ACC family enzyme
MTDLTYTRTEHLRDRLARTHLLDLPLHSRLHPLQTIHRLNASVFVKREDELPLAAGGSKVRKFASLLPFLTRHHFDEVWVVGGAQSNAVAGLVPLLRQQGQPYRLILRGAPDQYRPTGNHLLIRLCTPPEAIDWIARSDWPRALELTRTRAEALRAQGRSCYIVEEGASVEPALAGCLTLWADLHRHEVALGRPINHVLIDAGTGMTAAALLWADAYVSSNRQHHILLTAGTEESFAAVLARFGRAFVQWLGASPDEPPARYRLYPPLRPFGRVGPAELAASRHWFRAEGLPADPVYSAPLLDWTARVVAEQALSGTVVVIHGGGTAGLFGWADGLAAGLE